MTVHSKGEADILIQNCELTKLTLLLHKTESMKLTLSPLRTASQVRFHPHISRRCACNHALPRHLCSLPAHDVGFRRTCSGQLWKQLACPNSRVCEHMRRLAASASMILIFILAGLSGPLQNRYVDGFLKRMDLSQHVFPHRPPSASEGHSWPATALDIYQLVMCTQANCLLAASSNL